jgi:hypothetical protein
MFSELRSSRDFKGTPAAEASLYDSSELESEPLRLDAMLEHRLPALRDCIDASVSVEGDELSNSNPEPEPRAGIWISRGELA